jgi:hypothetical protein
MGVDLGLRLDAVLLERRDDLVHAMREPAGLCRVRHHGAEAVEVRLEGFVDEAEQHGGILPYRRCGGGATHCP